MATPAGLAAPTRVPPTKRAKIRAVAFDLFTLFDPRSVVAVAESIVPGRAKELCDMWRLRQFEYSWIQTAAARYVDFHGVTEAALAYALRAQKLVLTPEQQVTLVDAYERLEPWPDTREVLASLKKAGLRLAPLANFTPTMIANLLAHANLRDAFDDVISTDRAKTFKPDPRAYALGETVFGLRRDEIAFSAFGGWDAAGARWFGYPTFWVNRLGVPMEELAPGPHASGATLNDLATWIAEW